MARYFNDVRQIPVRRRVRGPSLKAMVNWAVLSHDRKGVGGRRVKGIELTPRQEAWMLKHYRKIVQSGSKPTRSQIRARRRANANRKFTLHVHANQPVQPVFAE